MDQNLTPKTKQGFEKNPPICRNCRNNIKDPVPVKGLGFVNRQCKIGGFKIKPYNICDYWTSKSGEKLEA